MSRCFSLSFPDVVNWKHELNKMFWGHHWPAYIKKKKKKENTSHNVFLECPSTEFHFSSTAQVGMLYIYIFNFKSTELQKTYVWTKIQAACRPACGHYQTGCTRRSPVFLESRAAQYIVIVLFLRYEHAQNEYRKGNNANNNACPRSRCKFSKILAASTGEPRSMFYVSP